MGMKRAMKRAWTRVNNKVQTSKSKNSSNQQSAAELEEDPRQKLFPGPQPLLPDLPDLPSDRSGLSGLSTGPDAASQDATEAVATSQELPGLASRTANNRTASAGTQTSAINKSAATTALPATKSTSSPGIQTAIIRDSAATQSLPATKSTASATTQTSAVDKVAAAPGPAPAIVIHPPSAVRNTTAVRDFATPGSSKAAGKRPEAPLSPRVPGTGLTVTCTYSRPYHSADAGTQTLYPWTPPRPAAYTMEGPTIESSPDVRGCASSGGAAAIVAEDRKLNEDLWEHGGWRILRKRAPPGLSE